MCHIFAFTILHVGKYKQDLVYFVYFKNTQQLVKQGFTLKYSKTEENKDGFF